MPNYPYVVSIPNGTAANQFKNYGNADTMGATFNYMLLLKEPGAWAHNDYYARRLIYDSIDYIDNGLLDNSVEATINALSGLTGTQKTNAINYLLQKWLWRNSLLKFNANIPVRRVSMKKRLIRSISITVIGGLALSFLYVGKASAIPAFTRAYKVECSTCHTIYPELNEYGEAFLKNAYVYFGKGKKAAKEEEAAAPAVSAKPAAAVADVKGEGDADKLSKLKAGAMGASGATASAPAEEATSPANGAVGGSEAKSEGILLAAIPELLPISFTASADAAYNRNAANELDLSTRALTLNAGGNFREKVAFFAAYVAYSENTSNIINTNTTSTTPANNSTNINEMYVIWRHAFDTPINFRVGRMEPNLSLWKSNNMLSVINPYAPYSYTVGVSEFYDSAAPGRPGGQCHPGKPFLRRRRGGEPRVSERQGRLWPYLI